VGHVGDSCCYRIRDEVIEQLSYDHSLLWEYARLKHLDPDEVEDVPSNVIHRCLGPEPQVQVDVEGPHAILAGDVYLLCSDGLSGQVSDQELGAVASVLPPTEACRFLVDLSKLRGGPDNITAIIVRVSGPLTAAVVVTRRARHRKPLPVWAWWLLILFGRLLVLVSRPYLRVSDWQGTAWAVFFLALFSFVTGFVGLVVHNLRFQTEDDSNRDRSPAKAHRRRVCKIEWPELDKLIGVLRWLRKHAEENNWNLDWKLCQEYQALADNLLASNDLPGAYREYCRAMLPLMSGFYPER
jgi:protein phosphatase